MLKRNFIFLVMTGILAVIGFSLLNDADIASANSESELPLDCLSCHNQELDYHDELGQGNNACWTCHDDTDMTQFRLADDTLISRDETSQLCGQCHQERYNAWMEGTHGLPGTVEATKCVFCHDPHEPQISLLGKTKPHPAPAPSPPDPPFDLIMIAAISVVFLSGLGIIVAMRGTG